MRVLALDVGSSSTRACAYDDGVATGTVTLKKGPKGD